MTLPEQLRGATSAPEEEALSPKIQAILDRSGLQDLLYELPKEFSTQRIITESGAKLVIDVSWGTEAELRRVPISIRAERIAFMGDPCAQYFREVPLGEVTPERVRQQFIDAAAHPQVIRR